MRLFRLTMTLPGLPLQVCGTYNVLERGHHPLLFAALKKAADDAEAARKLAEESAVRQLQACCFSTLSLIVWVTLFG